MDIEDLRELLLRQLSATTYRLDVFAQLYQERKVTLSSRRRHAS